MSNFPGFERPKRNPKAKVKADVPYKPEAIALMGLDRDEDGRKLTDAEVKVRIAQRAAHLADRKVRTVEEMATKAGLQRGEIEKHRQPPRDHKQ